MWENSSRPAFCEILRPEYGTKSHYQNHLNYDQFEVEGFLTCLHVTELLPCHWLIKYLISCAVEQAYLIKCLVSEYKQLDIAKSPDPTLYISFTFHWI